MGTVFRRFQPVDEANALFVGRRRFAQEGGFVDAEDIQGGANSREGAFADADNADVGAFQDGDFDR